MAKSDAFEKRRLSEGRWKAGDSVRARTDSSRPGKQLGNMDDLSSSLGGGALSHNQEIPVVTMEFSVDQTLPERGKQTTFRDQPHAKLIIWSGLRPPKAYGGQKISMKWQLYGAPLISCHGSPRNAARRAPGPARPPFAPARHRTSCKTTTKHNKSTTRTTC
ncbi:hypothetical protein [Herbaspirillum huttiense]|uniref:Uncharacterized protein n=2 Tax=Herbaspirillum huttiense TaxID=863372 RepID=A0AAJ2H232_9BURK|nr:hypothetical protein [Herbaspirillum huttiense]MDR9835132.1 hypothetical protein [Herbaspirillum huttiense]